MEYDGPASSKVILTGGVGRPGAPNLPSESLKIKLLHSGAALGYSCRVEDSHR